MFEVLFNPIHPALLEPAGVDLVVHLRENRSRSRLDFSFRKR